MNVTNHFRTIIFFAIMMLSGHLAAQIKSKQSSPPPPPPVKTVTYPPPIVSDRKDEKMIEIPDSSNLGKETKEGIDPFAIQSEDEWAMPEFKENKVLENNEQPYTFVDEEAEYPGGFAQIAQFISNNYNYPDIAREMGIQGKIYVRFTINTDGTVSDVSIEQKMVPSCPECDAEAIRIIRQLNGWSPAKVAGKKVPQYYILPIQLSLEEDNPPPQIVDSEHITDIRNESNSIIVKLVEDQWAIEPTVVDYGYRITFFRSKANSMYGIGISTDHRIHTLADENDFVENLIDFDIAKVLKTKKRKDLLDKINDISEVVEIKLESYNLKCYRILVKQDKIDHLCFYLLGTDAELNEFWTNPGNYIQNVTFYK